MPVARRALPLPCACACDDSDWPVLPCPALPFPALPFPCLPCPALPCPAPHRTAPHRTTPHLSLILHLILILPILTGQCAHNSGVIGAGYPPLSGFPRFLARGLENKTVPYFLQKAGYRTGLTGKVGGVRWGALESWGVHPWG